MARINEKIGTFRGSRPRLETGYDEQNNVDWPKIRQRSCANCVHFEEKHLTTNVKRAKSKGSSQILDWDYDSFHPICNKHGKLVDELFGSCDSFEKVET